MFPSDGGHASSPFQRLFMVIYIRLILLRCAFLSKLTLVFERVSLQVRKRTLGHAVMTLPPHPSGFHPRPTAGFLVHTYLSWSHLRPVMMVAVFLFSSFFFSPSDFVPYPSAYFGPMLSFPRFFLKAPYCHSALKRMGRVSFPPVVPGGDPFSSS